jgi:DNA-binding response OmpR family regulator
MRILIVEDDEAICIATKRVLAHVGHTSKCVDHFSDCAAAIADFDPEFIILDLNLPDSQGVPTLRAMYDLVDHHVPVIVFSVEPLWADECLELGAVEYLVKGNFTPMDIPDAIKRACGRFKLSRAIEANKRAVDGETSWPGVPSTDPGKVGDRLVSMASELRLLASGG